MKSSLSKKNGVCTTAGAGVNPAFSYKKFKKMQKLDREISKELAFRSGSIFKLCLSEKQKIKSDLKLFNLDTKRKETRLTNIN
jgi:hypothetical protein